MFKAFKYLLPVRGNAHLSSNVLKSSLLKSSILRTSFRFYSSENNADHEGNLKKDTPSTLFVGSLSWGVDSELLTDEFKSLPDFIGARVISDKFTGRSRGFGYIDFANKAAAAKALEEFQGREIEGRQINLDFSEFKPVQRIVDNKPPSTPTDTLYIGNLPFDTDKDALFDLLSKHATPVSVRLPTHPDSDEIKGFAFAQFTSVSEAEAARESLEGEYLDGRRLRFDYSVSRDNRSRRSNRDGDRKRFNGNRGRRSSNQYDY